MREEGVRRFYRLGLRASNLGVTEMMIQRVFHEQLKRVAAWGDRVSGMVWMSASSKRFSSPAPNSISPVAGKLGL